MISAGFNYESYLLTTWSRCLQVKPGSGFTLAQLTITNFRTFFLCKVDATNLLGNTPLHIACLNGQDIVITELISYGASVNATNKKGMVSGIYSTYSCKAIKQCPTVS